ncbi:MAG: hypothetical protein HQL87_07050 [Magnetococcales bacterium]|nr:hypothetical protein [Magnetococcales bacterium]
MNLLGQQQPSGIQQEGVDFSTVPPGIGMHNTETFFALGDEMEPLQPVTSAISDNTLALLEARLGGLSRMISGLNAKNGALHKMITDRDEYIELLEQENATLLQQVEQFAVTQGQVIDGLTHILSRFPGGESLAEDEAFYLTDVSLLEETVGNA